MEDLTGKQLGQYRVVAPLGEGGMAAVYKAYQANMDRYVALKILPRHLANGPEFAGRFEQEAKVIAQLQHPHILPVHDYGEYDGYTYIVMPFVKTGTLADLLKGKPLQLNLIHKLISQVGDALDYAHSRGVIHRDVKPSNVLIDERGNCLLTDFGIAKMVEGNSQFTQTGRLMGTPAYMSPEQGMGQALDARSDIYSLGVIFYEMATGRQPYAAETPIAVIMKHIHDPLPPPRSINPDIPESMERIILKALAKSREDRFSSASGLVNALQGYDVDKTLIDSAKTIVEPVVYPGGVTNKPEIDRMPETKTRTIKEGIKTNKGILVAAGVLILLGIFVSVLFFWREGKLVSPIITDAIQATEFAAIIQISTPKFDEGKITHTQTPTTPPPSRTPLLTPTRTKLPPSPTTIAKPNTDNFLACSSQCKEDGTNAASRYPGGTTKLYLRWSYKNIPEGAHYVRKWTMNGLEWVRYDCIWPGPSSGIDELTLSEPDGLHSGTWEVTITIDDEVIMSEQVYIDGNWSYWEPAGVFDTCYGKK
ncbi:MAG: serine/threonine-protein kinase [Anaerolineales bacterium]|jgi:serine/threonine protein kinase